MLNTITKKISLTLAFLCVAGSSFANDLPDIRGLEIDPITINSTDEYLDVSSVTDKATTNKIQSFTSEEGVVLKGEITRLTALVGKSHLIKFDEPVSRISITDPSIADLILISPTEMLVNGKTTGLTSLLIWGEEDEPVFFDLEVKKDITSLNDTISDLFPHEKLNMRVTDDAHVVLTGRVSSSLVKDKVQTLAEAYGYQFVDLAEYSKPQVMIEVKIAEASRAFTRQFGLQGTSTNGGGGDIDVTSFLPGDSASGSNNSSAVFDNEGIKLWSYGTSLYAGISAYEQKGLIKILAEPKLVTVSGVKAFFNAGQEVPVPTGLDETGQIAYEFKDVGVNVEFTPTLQEGSDRITLNVIPEVSEIDSTITIEQTDGSIIYGFRKRKAETTVDLLNGQTLVIAGLLQRDDITTQNQIPHLGDLPYIGKFFRSSEYRKGETELIIFVTPKIIRSDSKVNRI